MEKQYQITLMLHTYMTDDAQPENWQFTVTVQTADGAVRTDGETEEILHRYFQKFQGCDLRSIPPFDAVSPTPQSMADYFWQPLCELLANEAGQPVSLAVERSDGAVYTRRANSLVCRGSALPAVRSEVRTEKTKREHIALQWVTAVILLLLCAAGVTLWLCRGNGAPQGQHIWETLYNGDFTSRHPSCFSLFSSAAPLPYGLYTIILSLTGNVQIGYFVLLGLLYVTGVVGWMRLSKNGNGVLPAAILSVAWFLSPSMLQILFVKGNLPTAWCLCGIPYLLCGVYACMEEKKRTAFYGIAGTVFCMILSDAAVSCIAVIAVAVFILLYGTANRAWKQTGAGLAAIAVGILLSGFYLVPAIHGGRIGWMEETVSESILDALYPSGGAGSFYIGIAVFGVAIFGSLCCNWKRAAGFWTAAVGVVALVFLHKSLLLLIGMTVALGLVSAALLRWRSFPKWGVLVCAALLLADGVFAYYGAQPTDVMQQCVALPQEMSGQWVSVLGNVTPENGNRVIQNRHMSETYARRLEEAFENGYYQYVFDRSLEYGAQTVMIEKDKVPAERRDKLMAAATQSGYQYQTEVRDADVFWRQTPQNFGTEPTYRALGIGTAAYYAAWLFPEMQEGTSPYPEDYTIEELSRYQTVYLAGWKVRDKEAAEALLREAAARNIRIVAEAGTGEALFGLQTEEFVITGTMPTLSGRAELAEQPLDMMAHGITLKNAEDVWIWGEKNGNREAVAGVCGSVCYVGLQLPSFVAKEGRTEYLPILESVTGLRAEQPLERETVEIQCRKNRGSLMVQTTREGVVLPLAYADSVRAVMGEKTAVHGLLRMENTFLVLQQDENGVGLAVSVCGMLAAVCYAILLRRRDAAVRKNDFPDFVL